MATYQMLWDCSQCGTQKLLGVDHRFCPSCGAAQDPEARYFPSDADKIAVENHVYTGVDVRCPACDTPNAAIAKHCVACGAPTDKAVSVSRRDSTVVSDAAAPDSASRAKAEHSQDKAAAEAARIAAKTAPGKSPSRAALLGCLPLGVIPLALGCALIAALLLCCGLFFWSTPAEVVATGHRWERTVAIEALAAAPDSAWRDSVPSDARGVSCSQKQRDTKQIPDGQDCHTVREDNGDGTFTEKEKCTPRYRTEPIYEEYCTFTVDRWRVVKTERAAGGLTDPPRWPDARAGAGQRLGARVESYEVSFRDSKGSIDWCSFAESKWRSISVGASFSGSRGLTGSLSCGSLSGASP